MSTPICRLILLGLLLTAVSTKVTGEQSLVNADEEVGNKLPVFYVLLEGDRDRGKSNAILARARTGATSGFDVRAIDGPQLRSVRRMFPSDRYEIDRGETTVGEESARSKLGRYLVVEYERGIDIVEKTAALRNDSEVEAVHVDELMQSSASCVGGSSVVSYISFSKTWGFSKVRASQGWAYSTGHAYIGHMDLGVEMLNADIKDFNGNTYLFGNFHPHLAWNVGDRSVANGTKANPFTTSGYIGEVDEYYVKVHPSDSNDCDASPGNEDGYNASRFAGHGSATFGIIAANGTNSGFSKGVCKHCPVSVISGRYPSDCEYGTQPHTGQDYEAENYAMSFGGVASGIATVIDIGVQVINYSGGTPESQRAYDWCSSNSSDPFCLTVQYAKDRDVVLVAAAGNENDGEGIHWPASDERVVGVLGSSPSGISRWNEGGVCGSNYGGSNDTQGGSFIAPAEGIFTTMYADMNWSPPGCHEYNDDNGVGLSEEGDGYGYCTGTSLAAPFVTAIAGLVKSVNPLLSEDDVYTALKGSTGYGTWDDERGWGIPRTDYALQEAFGVVGGVQVRNRAIPLFNLYGETGEDFINTTKPQVVLAFTLNTYLDVDSDSSSPVVAGFTFAEHEDNPTPPTPRADIFILSSHYQVPAGKTVIPLYRMRWVGSYGGNPDDTDWALVMENEISSWHSVGYDMDGREGFIYATCSPEPSCIPTGATTIWRAYHSSRDDHAIFPQSRYSSMVSAGYSNSITKLGYAYPNVDSDSDGLIDGLEYVIGTDPGDSDTDNDGDDDEEEYPLAGLPQSDPDD